MSAARDMLACVKSAIVSAETAVAIHDATSGPERSNLDGYAGSFSMKHVQAAMRELEKARDLLTPVAENSAKEEVSA